MLIAPLLAAGGQLLLAPVRGQGAELATVAARLDAWRAAHGLLLVWAVLMGPVLLGLASLLRSRGTRADRAHWLWADGGGALAWVGLLAAFGITIDDLVVAEMAALGGGGQLDALLQRIGRLLYGLDLAEDLLVLGMVLLALGLLRARAAPPWAVALLLAGLALPYASPALLVASALLQWAGLGWIGVTVLRWPDERWADPPEQPAFPRPGWLGAAMTVLFIPGAVTAARFLALTAVVLALVIYRPRPGPPSASPGPSDPS